MEEAIQKAEHIGAFSTREEKEAIWHLAQQYITEGGLAIEVGTWTGGSAVIIGEVCRQKHARLICIDAFSSDIHGMGDGIDVYPFNAVLLNCEGLPIDYMAGDSRNFVNYLKPGIADFIFIDGDHRLPTVKVDIEGYWEALRPGGCYLMHDVWNPCDVKEVSDNFFGENALTRVDSAGYIIKGDCLVGKYPGRMYIVDDEDREFINKYTWHNLRGYAARYFRKGNVKTQRRMHHDIMGIPDSGLVIDHINGNKLDNRKENLRVTSIRENVINQGLHSNNTSGFKGVSKAGDKWRACICPERKQIHLGVFDTPEEAARAYDKAAKEIYGVFARFNLEDMT